MNKYFEILNSYFEKIYVITIDRATVRREEFKKNFEGLNYDFFYGVDKTTLDRDTLINDDIYNEERARKLNRYNKPMTIGHIACSLSHRKVYEDMIRHGYKNALIFEDDAVPDIKNLEFVPLVLSELPNDWELLYWGYEKNLRRGTPGFIKQKLYHLLRSFGKLKWNHTMIRNLYAKPYSKHLGKAGLHDLLHAYSITLSAARKLVEVQTPVAFNADPAVAYAVTNDYIKSFIAKPVIFYQEVQLNPESYHSFIKE